MVDVASRSGLLRAAAAGLVAGFVSGLFGVGGGILLVPSLVLLLHLEQRRAHATSLVAVIPIALTGVVGYAVHGEVDVVAALLLAVGAVIGALVGTGWLHRLSSTVLRRAFAVVLLLTAVQLALHVEDRTHDLSAADVVLLLAVGLLAGVLAGLLGVGGGIVMVPAMVLLAGIPTVVAKGTSLLVVIPTAVSGTYRNVRNGNADVRLGLVVGVSGALSAYGGALLSLRLDPRVSAVLFAVLLVLVAARMLLQRED